MDCPVVIIFHHIFINLQNVFAVIDLYGMVESVSVVSSATIVTDSSLSTPSVESETGHHISLVSLGVDLAFLCM